MALKLMAAPSRCILVMASITRRRACRLFSAARLTIACVFRLKVTAGHRDSFGASQPVVLTQTELSPCHQSGHRDRWRTSPILSPERCSYSSSNPHPDVRQESGIREGLAIQGSLPPEARVNNGHVSKNAGIESRILEFNLVEAILESVKP